jgi:hypothetical protein
LVFTFYFVYKASFNKLPYVSVTGDQIMLEDGYMVTTVLDGHKLNINPHAVQLRSSEIVVLDSSRSVFYTLPFPISQGNNFISRYCFFFFFLSVELYMCNFYKDYSLFVTKGVAPDSLTRAFLIPKLQPA